MVLILDGNARKNPDVDPNFKKNPTDIITVLNFISLTKLQIKEEKKTVQPIDSFDKSWL